jgi:hypothetical protein
METQVYSGTAQCMKQTKKTSRGYRLQDPESFSPKTSIPGVLDCHDMALQEMFLHQNKMDMRRNRLSSHLLLE